MTGLPHPVQSADPRFAAPRTLFFGVGAQKCGTSWLDRYLRDHPDVCLPVRKEQHYWDTRQMIGDSAGRQKRFARKAARAARLNPLRRLLRSADRRERDRAEELTHRMLGDAGSSHKAYADVMFQRWQNQPVVGEITPAYGLLDAGTFAEMASLAPDVRFFFVMRDPVDRLESGVRHALQRPRTAGPPKAAQVFARLEAILAAVDAGQSDAIFARSRYDLTMQALEQAVASSRLCYLYFETLFTQSEIDRLADFLGISRRPAALDSKVNDKRGQGNDLPVELAMRARRALAPAYDFVQARLGGRLPVGWRDARLDRAALTLAQGERN